MDEREQCDRVFVGHQILQPLDVGTRPCHSLEVEGKAMQSVAMPGDGFGRAAEVRTDALDDGGGIVERERFFSRVQRVE